MGITDVIVKVNPELTGLNDPWRYETLAAIVGRLKSAGLTVVGLEGDPFDMAKILATKNTKMDCSQMTIITIVHKLQMQLLHVLHVLHG